MKYTKEEKVEWVKQYLSGMPLKYPDGCADAVRFKDMVHKWARLYELHGEAALEHGKHKAFTTEEKRDAVMKAKKRGAQAVADELCIVPSVVRNWIRVYDEKGMGGLKSLGVRKKGDIRRMEENEKMPTQPSESKEGAAGPCDSKDTESEPGKGGSPISGSEAMERLREENLRLRAEVALLKKVKALAQEKKEGGRKD
jgi:transposase-like protein